MILERTFWGVDLLSVIKIGALGFNNLTIWPSPNPPPPPLPAVACVVLK